METTGCLSQGHCREAAVKNRRCWNGFCSRALGAAALRPERRDIVGGWYSSFTTFTVCIFGFLSRVSFPLPFTGQLWDLEAEVGWWGDGRRGITRSEFESWPPLSCRDSSARDSVSQSIKWGDHSCFIYFT